MDSERITTNVFSKILQEECGLIINTEKLLETFMGQSSEKCLSIIEDMLGYPPPSDLAINYQSAIRNALQESVTSIHGIEKVLTEINIPYCVASGGSHEKMKITLGKTDLLKYFEGRIFSTSDVSRAKPNPDIFLHAAKIMSNTNPKDCLVVEDSPLGVHAGVAAGMTVFAYSDLIEKQKLYDAGAHHVFFDMSDLTDEITSYEHKSSLK